MREAPHGLPDFAFGTEGGKGFDALDTYAVTEKVGIFVLASDANAAAMELDRAVDWGKVRDFLAGGAQFAGAFYYDHDTRPERRAYHEALSLVDFTIPILVYADHTPEELQLARERTATEFILDVARRSILCDIIWLVIHQARFAPLIQHLQGGGKRVFVLSARNLLDADLARISNKPLVHLGDLLDAITLDERQDGSPQGGHSVG